MRKSNSTIFFATIILLLFTFTHAVHAESGQTYEVGTETLNIRTAPGVNAEVVGTLKFGDQVTVFKAEHGWISTYYNGKEVWIASQYLFESSGNGGNQQPTQNASLSNHTNQTITVIADSVRLRNGPGKDRAVVGHASSGDTYTLVETSNDWHKVKLKDQTTVWIASWLTNKAIGGQTTSSSPDESSSSSSTQITSPSSTNQSSQPLTGYNIMLDAGHGGIDPGALGLYAEKEKVLALDFTKVIAQKLRDEGATVLLTRSKDSYVSLQDRVRMSESYWTDAFISIHFNAFTSQASNGISTHYYADGPDYELARQIQTALEKHTNLNSRGVKKDNYHVLRENSNLAVLVELGFITNPNDLAVVQNSSYSSNVAEAISEGVITYFNN